MVWTNFEVKNKNSKEWKVEQCEMVDEKCPHIEEKTKAIFSKKAYSQINTLCRLYEDLEWMAALVGEKVEKDSGEYYLIERLVIFEQEVNGCHVELTDEGSREMAKTKNLGWIHSHNTMSVFLSGTDVSTANFNELSFCVNNKLDILGKLRVRLPCGSDCLVKVDVMLERTDQDEETVEIAKKLIKEEKSIVSTITFEGDEENHCILCERIVGKRNRVTLNDGVVHRKCYEEYTENFESEMGCSAGKEYLDDYISNAFYEHNGDKEACDECEMPINYCQCDNNYSKEDTIRKYDKLIW